MAVLASVAYDPGTAVTKAAASGKAMTALDTTNLRLTFTAPANGMVLVRLRGTVTADTPSPTILLGVLEGATVKGRMLAQGQQRQGLAAEMVTREAVFIVTGLTPSNSYTWDAAYGVEFNDGGGMAIKYGGPNDSTTNNAWGAFHFEIWETTNLLGAKLYDPSTAVDLPITSGAAIAAIDTTNLRLTFTAPASGKVLWRIRTAFTLSTGLLFGILDGATVKARSAPTSINTLGGVSDSGPSQVEASGVISGLTPGNSYTFDAAYGVELNSGGSVKYGGPNNTTADDAWGAIAYEIWKA